MFEQVIVPLDGSPAAERAIAYAIAAATPLDLTVRLLQVAEEEKIFAAERYLESVEDQIVSPVPIALEVWDGDPMASIVRQLSGWPENLVVMASSGHGRTGSLVGSVVEGVLAHGFGPLLLVGPACAGPYDFRDGPLVLPTDGSHNAAIINGYAQQWAVTYNMAPWLVAVADPRTSSADVSEGDVFESNAVQSGVEALTGGDHPEPQWTILHDRHPDRAITTFATERDARLIAMSTHGKTGLKRLVAGSVTMSVLHHAPCPVLVVRPFGKT